MKTVLVTPELAHASAPGNIAAFAWHWSRVLRQAGEDVHLILTRPPLRPSHTWRHVYDDLGITLDVLEEPDRFIALPSGYRWNRRVAEVVYERLPPDSGVVYYAERDANAMHHLRRRRFSGERQPVVATVLHGGTTWQREGALRWPTRLEDLENDFYERYVTAHSDWVIAPNQALLRWATRAGWCLPPGERVRVAGYPYLPDDAHDGAIAATPRAVSDLPDPSEPVPPPGAPRFRRIVCYTVPAASEDLGLFGQALDMLRDKPCLDAVQEVVLLGRPGAETTPTGGLLQTLGQVLPGRPVTVRLDATPAVARSLLAERASETLVVVPRSAGGMEYAAIAATQVPGLQLLCADVGGMADVLGAGVHLCEPFATPLARALERRLLGGPHEFGSVTSYAWQVANQGWLALHHEIAQQARDPRQEAATAPPRVTTKASGAGGESAAGAMDQVARSLDVCVPFYNLGAYLPALLEALDKQTSHDFNVFVVNDGSSDASSVAVFEAMARTYAHHPHWRFVSTENQGVCAARNLAASLGTAEYLCFIDADNVPLPSMIERFLAGMRQSGDDCLTCYLYTIERDGTFKSGLDLRHSPLMHYLPVGNCLPMGVFTNPFGDINCIMRRAVFEAVGGFTTDVTKFVNHEDRELLTRLAFGGFRLDVIPEFLCYYRLRPGSRLRTTDQFLNDARVMRVYLERLRGAGLPDLVPLVPLTMGLLHGEEGYHVPPISPNQFHFLSFEVSGVLLAKALVRRAYHYLRARLNRLHQTP